MGRTIPCSTPATMSIRTSTRSSTRPASPETSTVYEESISKMVDIVMTELPRIPLYTRFADYAMQKDVQGFEYWFHVHPDFRKLYKV